MSGNIALSDVSFIIEQMSPVSPRSPKPALARHFRKARDGGNLRDLRF